MNDIAKAIEWGKSYIKKQSYIQDFNQYDMETLIKIAEKQLTNSWIPVSVRLPENEERVLICCNRKCYSGETIQIRTTAMYEDGTMHTEDSGYSWKDNDFEYCEETYDYIIPEVWYEQNMYCEEFGIVDDFVIAWQPLPEPYKEDK